MGPLVRGIDTQRLIREATLRLRAGALDDAAGLAEQLAALAPEDAEASHLRGLVALQRGDAGTAVALLTEAAGRCPAEARFHGNLAAACRQAQDNAAAEATCRRALALAPAQAEYHATYANLLKDLARHDEALAAYGRALTLAPGYDKVRFNLGNLLHDLLRLDAAERALRRTAAADGEVGLAGVLNLGRVLEKMGRRGEALGCYEQVLDADPGHTAARWNRALLLLQAGDLDQGFREYEWRWRLPEHPPRPFRQPAWHGEDLAGGTLLVHAEQGFGDTIQFCRYLPLAAARAGRVVFECQPALARLMARSFPGITVVAAGHPLPAFDRHVALLSLPLVLGTRHVADIPADVPYLRAAAPPDDLTGGDGLAVGLVWAGSPGHNLHATLRSIPPDDLAPLLRVPGVRLISLQVGPHAGEAGPLGLVDAAPRLGDFADTADCIGGLDLVITIDTAVAHLAGALGKPVWILLRDWPDWRWFLDRLDTPWYPTASLFRQERIGHWRPLVEAVARRLERRLERLGDEYGP